MNTEMNTEDIFEKPENEHVYIWRYLDFAGFTSLLDKCALFFASAELLRKGDRFEGSFSKANLELRPELYKDLGDENIAYIRKTFYDTYKSKWSKEILINCWHLNEFESAAMWSLYSSNGRGVAIQSTFNGLKSSFVEHSNIKVYVGKVKYADYLTEFIPENNVFYPFMYKRKSFEHERELRAICWLPSTVFNEETTPEIMKELNSYGGIYIPIKIETLISKIFVSPLAPAWFKDVVVSMLKLYGLEIEVVQSSLSEDPVY